MLEQRRAQEKGFITLKEAAEISDYSADYIGQLIRAGKIEGQQVYSNVAWVTTEDSINSYMSAKNKQAHSVEEIGSNLGETLESFGFYFLYALAALLAIVCMVLFYIFSVSIDKFITDRFAQSAAETDDSSLVVIYE